MCVKLPLVFISALSMLQTGIQVKPKKIKNIAKSKKNLFLADKISIIYYLLSKKKLA